MNHMDQTLDDIKVTEKIVARFFEELMNNLDVDVAIAGAGPSAMVAGRYLAKAGKKVVVFERKLTPGGGMWGGGMTFPVIVVQETSLPILEEINVRVRDEGDGYYTADSVETSSKLIAGLTDAGARLFNTISVEDVMIRDDQINGFVINWSAVEAAGLHVDPLTIRAKYCIDATGHPSEVCHVVQEKVGELHIPDGLIKGERSMWAEMGERTVVENTQEVYPGLWVAGMAANAVMGAPRMGPIFGGMLLSGKKCARQILERL